MKKKKGYHSKNQQSQKLMLWEDKQNTQTLAIFIKKKKGEESNQQN